MSYQVIARKWRPQTFEEVTGQEHITRTLRNALDHDRLHHAYLFSGARGVGKTTTARLLAKALNCHKTDKPNLNPCAAGDPNACPSCVEISESRSIDVLEFDAASHTKVEEIRDIILESINIAPARDRYKVFIIDEVHQLSNHSFNALLKTLEEPPPKVAFIMATTELHKVPETIRSRCQEFEFRTIPLQKIFDRLKLIAKAENIGIDDTALREIARSGMGSMRDAQSNFDQVISFSGEKIAVDDVTAALGLASTETLTQVVRAITEKSPKLVLDVVADLVSRGQDMRSFCSDLLAVFRDLMVFKVSGGEIDLIESSVLDADVLKKFSEPFTEADLLRFFNAVSETETKLKEAVQPRYVLETGLVRLVEMRRVVPVEQLLERLAQLERSLGGSNGLPQPAAAPADAEKKTLISEPVAPEPPDEPEFVPSEPPVQDYPEPPIFEPAPPPPPVIDMSFIDSMPVKLAPIDAELLEHVDDTWLDAAYDKKLERSGDDLAPMPDVSRLVEELLGKSIVAGASHVAANGAASAAAPALSPAYAVPDFSESDDVPEPETLAENATDDEMLAYASNHPLTRKAMRIFRAKIVEVKRIDPT
ncbi:MAG TPA: DNA polymerase III subunit gamma/tau [Pyrinomonadaceae bacterium]|nr:DNA polymerase III subunit gamma/tau [Pyrinomonadaceae bacterium]